MIQKLILFLFILNFNATRWPSDVFFVLKFHILTRFEICKKIFFSSGFRYERQMREKEKCPAVTWFFIRLVFDYKKKKKETHRTDYQINWKCNAWAKWNLHKTVVCMNLLDQLVFKINQYEHCYCNCSALMESLANERAKSQFSEFI